MNDFDKTLFSIDIPGASPAAGSLLVAEPFLRERYFAHAVICLIEYEKSGTAMGIVMNRPTRYSLQELIGEISVSQPITVFCGGPMSCDRLFYIHSLGDILPGSKKIAAGLYTGGSVQAMIEYVNAGYPLEGHIRFFIGYSGWSRNQLDEEIASKVWAVSNVNNPSDILSGDNDRYWHREVRRLGDSYRGWLFHPLDINAN